MKNIKFFALFLILSISVGCAGYGKSSNLNPKVGELQKISALLTEKTELIKEGAPDKQVKAVDDEIKSREKLAKLMPDRTVSESTWSSAGIMPTETAGSIANANATNKAEELDPNGNTPYPTTDNFFRSDWNGTGGLGGFTRNRRGGYE